LISRQKEPRTEQWRTYDWFIATFNLHLISVRYWFPTTLLAVLS